MGPLNPRTGERFDLEEGGFEPSSFHHSHRYPDQNQNPSFADSSGPIGLKMPLPKLETKGAFRSIEESLRNERVAKVTFTVFATLAALALVAGVVAIAFTASSTLLPWMLLGTVAVCIPLIVATVFSGVKSRACHLEIPIKVVRTLADGAATGNIPLLEKLFEDYHLYLKEPSPQDPVYDTIIKMSLENNDFKTAKFLLEKCEERLDFNTCHRLICFFLTGTLNIIEDQTHLPNHRIIRRLTSNDPDTIAFLEFFYDKLEEFKEDIKAKKLLGSLVLIIYGAIKQTSLSNEHPLIRCFRSHHTYDPTFKFPSLPTPLEYPVFKHLLNLFPLIPECFPMGITVSEGVDSQELIDTLSGGFKLIFDPKNTEIEPLFTERKYTSKLPFGCEHGYQILEVCPPQLLTTFVRRKMQSRFDLNSFDNSGETLTQLVLKKVVETFNTENKEAEHREWLVLLNYLRTKNPMILPTHLKLEAPFRGGRGNEGPGGAISVADQVKKEIRLKDLARLIEMGASFNEESQWDDIFINSSKCTPKEIITVLNDGIPIDLPQRMYDTLLSPPHLIDLPQRVCDTLLSPPHLSELQDHSLLYLEEKITKKLVPNDKLLHKAVREGKVELVRRLCQAGIPVNQRGVHQKTPVHEAVKQGSVEMIAALADLGADMNLFDNICNPPIYYASDPDTLYCLLRLGASPIFTDRFNLNYIPWKPQATQLAAKEQGNLGSLSSNESFTLIKTFASGDRKGAKELLASATPKHTATIREEMQKLFPKGNLDWFFESVYTLDEQHITNYVGFKYDYTNPPNVPLTDLVTLVNRYPFTREHAAKLRRIKYMIDQITRRKDGPGVPPIGPARNQWYNEQEVLLKKNITRLQQETDEDKVRGELEAYATVAGECSPKHGQEIRWQYRTGLGLPQEPFEKRLLDLLALFRSECVDLIASNYFSGEVHHFNNLMHLLGTRYKIFGGDGVPSDVYGAIDLDKAIRLFESGYTPTTVIDRVMREFSSGDQGMFPMDDVVDWFKTLFSEGWEKEKYDSILASVKKMEQEGQTQKEIESYLEETHDIFTRPQWSPVEAVRNDQSGTFLEGFVYEPNTTKVRREAVIALLKKLKVLKTNA